MDSVALAWICLAAPPAVACHCFALSGYEARVLPSQESCADLRGYGLFFFVCFLGFFNFFFAFYFMCVVQVSHRLHVKVRIACGNGFSSWTM